MSYLCLSLLCSHYMDSINHVSTCILWPNMFVWFLLNLATFRKSHINKNIYYITRMFLYVLYTYDITVGHHDLKDRSVIPQ